MNASLDVAPRLVIIRPTSLCNLNCSYCYVAGRQDKRIMEEATLEALAKFVSLCSLADKEVEILWHAGEPLSAGIDFYRRAFAILKKGLPEITINHTIQTNGTLINDDWCELFINHKVSIGLSVDGPAFIHNASRRTWGGGNTHERVMKGYQLMEDRGIRPGVICVLTSSSLEHPDAIYDFFKSTGFRSIAFNVDEAEGAHAQSSLARQQDVERLYTQFIRRIWQRWRSDESPLVIREFKRSLQCIYAVQTERGFAREPDETVPFAILTIGREGSISTFSPEFLSMKSPQYGDFIIGNVHRDEPSDITNNPNFHALHRDVEKGRLNCESTCPYYPICGGGFLSNRFSEHGNLLMTETLTCRLHRQVLSDVIIDGLIVESVAKQ